jgi:hypothetical protein
MRSMTPTDQRPSRLLRETKIPSMRLSALSGPHRRRCLSSSIHPPGYTPQDLRRHTHWCIGASTSGYDVIADVDKNAFLSTSAMTSEECLQ